MLRYVHEPNEGSSPMMVQSPLGIDEDRPPGIPIVMVTGEQLSRLLGEIPEIGVGESE